MGSKTLDDYSVTNQNKITPLAEEQMDQDIVICGEVNQREKHIIRCHLRVESINLYKGTTIQNRKTHEPQKPEFLLLIKKSQEEG